MAIQPKGIVIHSMGEYLNWKDKWITAHEFLIALKLSVHGFIHPDGLYESMVQSPGKAFHAGKSVFGELSGLNSHFLGFELLVPGTHDFGTFSKAIETSGKLEMNVAISVNHALTDGYHISLFVDAYQDFLNSDG